MVPDLLQPFVRAAVMIVAVIALCRINGLRSFSKMSAFDFALTVATGSLLAGTIQNLDQSLLIGIATIVAIFAVQSVISYLRRKFRVAQRLTDNEPLLLMADGRILHDHLAKARVTEDDLRAKLRAANVLSFDSVRAVVLETTGDMTVVHSTDASRALDSDLLAGVRTTL